MASAWCSCNVLRISCNFYVNEEELFEEIANLFIELYCATVKQLFNLT